MCRAIGREDLLDDEEFRARILDPEFAPQVDEILYPSLLARGKQEIMRAAQAEGWPVCALNTTEDVFADPQFRARGFFTTLDPVAGSLEYPGLPIRMRGTPGELRRTPTLGEHSSEILARHLGYTPEQLTILRQRGVV